MFYFGCDSFKTTVEEGSLPVNYEDYKKHSTRSDEFGLDGDGKIVFVGVGKNFSWPTLTIVFKAPNWSGFSFGAFFVPETDLLFLASDENIWIYDLVTTNLVQQDCTDFGFWGWERYNDVVFMSAELELVAWSLTGEKLWSRFAEPPWEFNVQDGQVVLDIMGKVVTFDMYDGPDKKS